jgi:hypothetical protein
VYARCREQGCGCGKAHRKGESSRRAHVHHS